MYHAQYKVMVGVEGLLRRNRSRNIMCASSEETEAKYTFSELHNTIPVKTYKDQYHAVYKAMIYDFPG